MKISEPYKKRKILDIAVFCRVMPMQRPRINKHRNGIYQPKATQRDLMHELSNYDRISPIKEPVVVDVHIHLEEPIKGDCDNRLKAINDNLVHMKIIKDDRFIMGGKCYQVPAKENWCHISIWSVRKSLKELNCAF